MRVYNWSELTNMALSCIIGELIPSCVGLDTSFACLYIVSHGKMRRPEEQHETQRTKHRTKVEGGIRLKICEYFSRIFPSTKPEMYYPSRKNSGIFVCYCFHSAGSNYFHPKAGKMTSADVPLERKIYDGSRTMSQELKESFKTFDEDRLSGYFEKIIDKDKYDDIMLACGIPVAENKKPQALRKALVVQFRAFIDSDTEEAADIVAMMYQQYLEDPEPEVRSFHRISSLYPDDTVYMKPEHKRSYSGYMYDRLEVTWKFSNLGKQTWKGRRLYLSNHDEIRPRAESNYVEIPDTPPNTGVQVSVTMDLRPFEDTWMCKWIMIDSEGNDCFPGSRMFDIEISVKFKRKSK